MSNGKPHVLVLGGNFAGLGAARGIRDKCGEEVKITLIDRKPYLLFIPNIGIEVLENRDPADTMHMPIIPVLDRENITFIQGEVKEIDLQNARVSYGPVERPGAATARIGYDYLVAALGACLAYDKIEGFADYGDTVSDSFYGNKLRRYLHGGEYKGGPIAIGSARFHQGSKGKPDWMPVAEAACEGPPIEMALSLASWLQEKKLGGPKNITLFTPGELIAEDAGKEIVDKMLNIASEMGFGYKNNTEDISRITDKGVFFVNGDSLEAELKIIFPDWEPHDFMKGLPISDEMGFVVTDLTMRNPDYPNVLAAGDCAALTVPKLGSIGHVQAEIVAKQIAKDLGKIDAEEADKPFWPEVLCIGDMGNNKAFYIHSDTWYGGKMSHFRMGYTYYLLKLAYKEMFFRTGGKVPGWGVPTAEFLAEKVT